MDQQTVEVKASEAFEAMVAKLRESKWAQTPTLTPREANMLARLALENEAREKGWER